MNEQDGADPAVEYVAQALATKGYVLGKPLDQLSDGERAVVYRHARVAVKAYREWVEHNRSAGLR